MLSQVSVILLLKQRFTNELSALRTEIPWHYSEFESQKKKFELLRDTFDLNVETALVQIQMELIERLCNGTLKKNLSPWGHRCSFTSFRMLCSSSYMHLQSRISLEVHVCASICSLWWTRIKCYSRPSHRWSPAIHREKLNNT